MFWPCLQCRDLWQFLYVNDSLIILCSLQKCPSFSLCIFWWREWREICWMALANGVHNTVSYLTGMSTLCLEAENDDVSANIILGKAFTWWQHMDLFFSAPESTKKMSSSPHRTLVWLTVLIVSRLLKLYISSQQNRAKRLNCKNVIYFTNKLSDSCNCPECRTGGHSGNDRYRKFVTHTYSGKCKSRYLEKKIKLIVFVCPYELSCSM